jgi:hypothetical protein
MTEEKAIYELMPEVRQSIIAQKIALWRNTAFDAELDAKVARVLDNKDAETNAIERLKNCLKAIATLEEMLG